MSLKKYKTKSNLIEEQIDYLELYPFKNCSQWWNSYYFYDEEDEYYDYDYSPCDNCGKTYCHDYEYCQEPGYIELPKIDWGYKIVNKAFRRWNISDPTLPGVYLDMETIYGKKEMRNRRIDIVLGLREPSYQQNVTIGDFVDRIDKNWN